MMRSINLLILIAIMIGLSGCSNMNSNFDCPMKDGIRCQSLDQVNDAVDSGEIGGGSAKGVSYSSPYMEQAVFKDNPAYMDSSTGLSPIRNPESVVRVWVAPFEDTEGNFHQASDVYAVSKPGYWIGHPVKAIKGEV